MCLGGAQVPPEVNRTGSMGAKGSEGGDGEGRVVGVMSSDTLARGGGRQCVQLQAQGGQFFQLALLFLDRGQLIQAGPGIGMAGSGGGGPGCAGVKQQLLGFRPLRLVDVQKGPVLQQYGDVAVGSANTAQEHSQCPPIKFTGFAEITRSVGRPGDISHRDGRSEVGFSKIVQRDGKGLSKQRLGLLGTAHFVQGDGQVIQAGHLVGVAGIQQLLLDTQGALQKGRASRGLPVSRYSVARSLSALATWLITLSFI